MGGVYLIRGCGHSNGLESPEHAARMAGGWADAANPRSLVYALFTGTPSKFWWGCPASLQCSPPNKFWGCIAKGGSGWMPKPRGAALRAMVNADILNPALAAATCSSMPTCWTSCSRADPRHELGLAAVLQARVAAIREPRRPQRGHASCRHGSGAGQPTSSLNSSARSACNWIKTATLLELAEDAKSADASMPIAQRYRRVLEAL